MCKGVFPMSIWTPGSASASPVIHLEAFYSKLSGSDISDKVYTHAQHVWAAFGCTNLGGFSDLHCRIDMLLLAEVSEAFQKTCLQWYGLNSARYYTSPFLSLDALLKNTMVEMDLLTDSTSTSSSRRGFREASPWCRSTTPGQITPEWKAMTLRSRTAISSTSMQTTSMGWPCLRLYRLAAGKMVVEHPAGDPGGFILEVDMEYPEDLHNTHNAYPLAPECMVVQKQWMSEYQHNLGVELVPRVNLKKHGPLQWPPFVNPRQSFGNLCCILAGQGLCHFVT